jgi:hypothetical protein
MVVLVMQIADTMEEEREIEIAGARRCAGHCEQAEFHPTVNGE